MVVLVDTNVLLRAIQRDDALCEAGRRALTHLHRGNDQLCLTSENVREFWNVCTRPTDKNGLGMSTAGTERQLELLERYLYVLPDSPLTHSAWLQLVTQHHVVGSKVHDAYLVASMQIHGS